jgi:hypothetical protein
MRLLLLIGQTVVLAVAGCARRTSPNVMTLSGPCDSAPPSADSARHRTASIPGVPRSGERGTVVGTITETATDRPLWYGVASLRNSANPAVALLAQADSLGGFALTDIPPGAYTLLIRAINHQYNERRIVLRPGGVDTIRAELRYHDCRGY